MVWQNETCHTDGRSDKKMVILWQLSLMVRFDENHYSGHRHFFDFISLLPMSFCRLFVLVQSSKGSKPVVI